MITEQKMIFKNKEELVQYLTDNYYDPDADAVDLSDLDFGNK